jgi:ADP-heptose:LPS heptosyltransferase
LTVGPSNTKGRTEPIAGVKSIAVLRANAVGDFIFALPAFAALRETYPKAHLVLLGKRWHADFLRDRPEPVDEVIEIPDIRGVGAAEDCSENTEAVEAFTASMRARDFDLVFQLHGGGRYSNPFVKRLGGRCTLGLRASETEPLDATIDYIYMQNERLRLLEVAGLAGARTHNLDPRLPLLARDFIELRERVYLPDQPLVVLHPGASDARRRWPPECFAQVGDALAAEGAAIAVNGVEHERALTSTVLRAMRAPAMDLTGLLSLSGLAGLLCRASVVVSNDTGPLHLAQALGTATVGIYWLTNLFVSSPLIYEGRRYAVSFDARCPVCGLENIARRCEHDVSFVQNIPPAQVAQEARTLLAARAPAAAAAHPHYAELL